MPPRWTTDSKRKYMQRKAIDHSQHHTPDPKFKIHQGKDQSIIPKFSQV
jgi:hypothetical protein